MSIIQKASTSLHAAARSLLLQHKYSNGYISVGDSEIGEANIVLHAAASLLQSGLHVWAESPFKTHESDQCKHLDLLVDLTPTDPNVSTLLTIDAKRIAAGENDGKIQEIINYYGRIRSWRNLEPAQMPLFFSIAQPVEWFFGDSLLSFLSHATSTAIAMNRCSPPRGKNSLPVLRDLRMLASSDLNPF